MLGLDGYGSGDDSDRGSPQPSQQKPSVQPVKPDLPKNTASSSKRPTKKITVALPSITPCKDGSDGEIDTGRPVKKQKIGAGVSSLLSMLPTPKEVNPTAPTQRVLGGGSGRGLIFQTQSFTESSDTYPSHSSGDLLPEIQPTSTDSAPVAPPTLFRPTSLAKGKRNISLEETNINQTSSSAPTVPLSAPSRPAAPAADFFSFSSISKTELRTSGGFVSHFFSLGSSKPESSTASSDLPTSSLPKTLSAAPELPTYEPPEPTPTDPYPGYYQLPSGTWAAYNTEYYSKFMKKWENEYNAHVRALEKGTIKGFEGLQNADVEEIDALKEMEKAKKEIQEREEKKAVTQGAGGGPIAPKMNINVRLHDIVQASKIPNLYTG